MTAFLIYVKRCLRIKIFVAVLFFMPIISIVFSIFGKNVIGEVKFGVYAEGDFGRYISESLEKEDNFKFVKYSSIAEMSSDVRICEIDCGYVFDKNFEDSLKKNDLKDSIKIISSDSSSGYTFANEIVFSKVLNTVSPNIANTFLDEINISGNVEKYYYDILKSVNVFSFNYIEVGEKTEDESVFEFRKIFACFVLIGSVFGSIVCVEDRRKNINKSCFLNIMSFSALLSVSAIISSLICGELSLLVVTEFVFFAFVSAAFAYLFTFFKNIFFICGSIPVITSCSFLILFLNITAGPFSFIFDIFKWVFPVGLYCDEDIVGMLIYFFSVIVLVKTIVMVKRQ